jgi:hypothetical protein
MSLLYCVSSVFLFLHLFYFIAPQSCFSNISFPQPIHKDDFFIQISLEIDHPCNHENDEFESKSSQISLPSPISPNPCHQLVKTCFQPTEFQSKLRQRVFKPLKLPAHLHPYPPYFVEYLPHFTGENHISA